MKSLRHQGQAFSSKNQLKDEVTNATPIWSRVRDLLNDVTPELPSNAVAPNLIDDRGYAFTQLIALNWVGNGEPDIASLGRFANELQNELKLYMVLILFQSTVAAKKRFVFL